MIFQIGQFDEVRSATMVSRETLQVQVRERHETEEIRKISRMQKDSIVDSKRFRRSERLQSILGKMRDGRDEEWNQVVQSESIKSSGHTISENETRDQEQTDEAIEPTNIEIRIDHEGGNTIQNEEESQKEPHEWSSSEYGENPETREEPDEIQEREDHIREQINLAVKDSMMGTDGVATMPVIKVLPTKESSGDSSRRGQRVSSPKSPQKNTTSRKSLSSPRGGKRISQRKKEFKGELEEYCSESESSSDRAHQVKSRSSKSKKNLPEKIKSISSDISKDSIISSDSSSSDAGSRGSSDGYSSSSSMKHLTKPEISRKKIIGIETKNLDGEQTKGTIFEDMVLVTHAHRSFISH